MAEKLPTVDTTIDEQFDSVKWLKHPIPKAREWMADQLRHMSDSCRCLALDKQTGVDLDVPYGENVCDGHGQEAFDWFPPQQWPSSPGEAIVLIIFLHGGYWQALDLPESSHWATSITKAGGVFAGLAYRLAPWQTLPQMVKRISLGVGRVFEHTLQRLSTAYPAYARVRLFLCGHSAGAQLALEVVFEALEKRCGYHKPWLSALDGVVLISGVYDLRPIVYTNINKALGMRSEEEAWAVSPVRHFIAASPSTLSVRYFLAWVEMDPPALVEQSQRLVSLMESSGCSVKSCFIEDEDHFSSILKLHESCSVGENKLLHELLNFVGLLC